MSNLWFWKNWRGEYKTHWYILLVLALSTLVLFGYYHFKGVDSIVQWERFQEQKIIETSIHEFQVGAFELSIPANVYILFEYFQGSRLRPNVFVSYAFVLVLTLAFIYLITIFSALERFWYFASMSIVILFLVSLRLDVLAVFGLGRQWFSIGVIAVYVITSFYIHTFRPATFFQTRLLIFTVITVVTGSLIWFFAEVPLPFLYISVTAYVPAILLTLLFMVMVAHEIPAVFLYLTSQSQSAKGLLHFLIIMVIYLVNLILLYAHSKGYIDWNILYLNIYLVFSITSIVGLWGWRHREVRYETIMPFYPFAAYFYLTLAGIAFSTLAFLRGTANDAPLETLSDLLVFCHIGFGFILVLYIFSNFMGVFEKNLSAWKVMYKPNRMPYETFRLGGIIVVLSFIFYNDWKNYVYNGFSGFWNLMGDLYVETERADIAQTYYEQGRSYGYANHHSNYAKAYYYAADSQWEKSHAYYERAGAKQPSVFALVNNANIYNWEENYFAGIFGLQQGLAKIPGSPEIMNNLGFFYGKVHALDSSLYFLNEARKHSDTRYQAETNFVGVAAQELVPISPDSLASLFDLTNPGVAANALGLATITHTNFKSEVKPFQQGALTLHQATLLNNYILNKAAVLSANELANAEKISRDSLNSYFSEALQSALAHAHYLQGNVNHAMQLMGELAYISTTNQGKYNYFVGLWMLEQGDPEAAAAAFRSAQNQNFKNASLYLAMAETEGRKGISAQMLWDSVRRNGNEQEKELAASLKTILSMSFQQVLQSTDIIKYQFCRYRLSTRDTVNFNVLVKSLRDNNYKAQALAEMSLRQFSADRLQVANRYTKEAASLQASIVSVKELVFFTQLQITAALGELDALAKLVENVEFPLSRKLDKLYYEALLNEAGGDKQKAERAFALLAKANPFYEEGVIAAAYYFKRATKDNFKAYEVLSDVVQVNKSSIRLWKAYIAEAVALGFDEYAASASAELHKQMAK